MRIPQITCNWTRQNTVQLLNFGTTLCCIAAAIITIAERYYSCKTPKCDNLEEAEALQAKREILNWWACGISGLGALISLVAIATLSNCFNRSASTNLEGFDKV